MLGRRALAVAIMVVAASTALVFAAASGAGTAGKAKTIKLSAKLKGANENPPVDTAGTGRAEVKLKPKKARVCFEVKFQGIGKAIAAHIHKGGPNENGDVRVLFFEDTKGVSSPQEGCVHGQRSVIKKIGKHPKRWYVNVHTAEFPAGAIRGQLRSGDDNGGGGGGDDSGGGGTGGGGGGGGGGYPYPS